MCFMTKCPYVPPHPWNVDFPHLMLRAKAVRARKDGIGLREKVLAATDTVGAIAGIPVIVEIVNAVNHSGPGRALLDKVLGVDPRRAAAAVPRAHRARAPEAPGHERAADERRWRPQRAGDPETTGRVALFATCYGNRNEPALDEDLVAVFEHNGIEMTLLPKERCCGMPRLELGDLEAVARLKEANIPQLAAAIAAGYDLVAPIPSCVLMFKQELPLMYPEDAAVKQVAAHIFDPFEYLMLRHAAGLLRTDFKGELGKVSYHVACHLRVQNLGLKTRDVLQADSRHDGRRHRALLGPQRHLRGEEGVPRRLGEDRPPGGAARRERQGRSLQQRLPDGRPPDREHPQREARAGASPAAAAPRLRHLKAAATMEKLAVTDLMPLEQYARERPAFRAPRAQAQGAAHARRGSQLHLAVRGSPDGAVPGAGDAAHRAHLRARGHRRGTGRLQPADSRWQQLEGDAAAGI